MSRAFLAGTGLLAALVISAASSATALTCEDEITRLTGLCIQQKGLSNARACRMESVGRVGNCRNLQGNMADFTGQAEQGRNDPEGYVYKTCDQKRREGYVLEKYEYDLCGGFPRRDN